MVSQAYGWTCSVCSITWALQSTNTISPRIDIYEARYEVGMVMGYPNCVNETYGCMSADCVKNTFTHWGLRSRRLWDTFDEAYAICREHTGVINPVGMQHYMAIRGVDGFDIGSIWVANSAPGYRGVWDHLSRDQFNSLGPVEVVYLESYK